MRHDGKPNPRNTKDIARRHYNIRQMDKFIKWTFEIKGYLKWKVLVEQQEFNNIRPHE